LPQDRRVNVAPTGRGRLAGGFVKPKRFPPNAQAIHEPAADFRLDHDI
jgi:hypothetical protein